MSMRNRFAKTAGSVEGRTEGWSGLVSKPFALMRGTMVACCSGLMGFSVEQSEVYESGQPATLAPKASPQGNDPVHTDLIVSHFSVAIGSEWLSGWLFTVIPWI